MFSDETWEQKAERIGAEVIHEFMETGRDLDEDELALETGRRYLRAETPEDFFGRLASDDPIATAERRARANRLSRVLESEGS